ncbi:MAG: hypothetical protein R3244_13675, partial [Thermoanaerobaculia bacterium]|nr:hypothetical protein [Thermoanaerobaculia bacterium]
GRVAFELWRNRLAGTPYPETLPESALPIDTFSGDPIVYERLDAGTARIAAPGAIVLWQEVHPEPTAREMPVFVWEMPAPTGAPVEH